LDRQESELPNSLDYCLSFVHDSLNTVSYSETESVTGVYLSTPPAIWVRRASESVSESRIWQQSWHDSHGSLASVILTLQRVSGYPQHKLL